MLPTSNEIRDNFNDVFVFVKAQFIAKSQKILQINVSQCTESLKYTDK